MDSKDSLTLCINELMTNSPGSLDVCNLGTLNFSTVNSAELKVRKLEWGAENSDNDMCQLDENDFVEGGVKLRSVSTLDDLTKVYIYIYLSKVLL